MSDRIRNLDDFLLLLGGVKPGQAGQYTALCPGHSDKQRSLSVKQAEGKILVKCFAGCELNDILKPLGLEPQDLFFNSSKPKPQDREIEAVYRYTDASGKPFEVVRTRPKGFYQRQPDGKGGYVNNIKGIKPTLYYQGDLESAVIHGDVIFICEGEKDADRLRTEGFTATCNAMGADKWRDSYSKALIGANVVIIPDNDQPGP